SRLAFLQNVMQAAVGQFHDDDELVLTAFDPFDGEQERVAQVLDALNGQQLIGGGTGAVVQGTAVAVDELDRLDQSARGLTLPDLAEAALAQRRDQAIARNGFSVGFVNAQREPQGEESKECARTLRNLSSGSGPGPIAGACAGRSGFAAAVGP